MFCERSVIVTIIYSYQKATPPPLSYHLQPAMPHSHVCVRFDEMDKGAPMQLMARLPIVSDKMKTLVGLSSERIRTKIMITTRLVTKARMAMRAVSEPMILKTQLNKHVYPKVL